MKILSLTRNFYNNAGVFGTLKILDTKQRIPCTDEFKTVERPQVPKGWEKMTSTQRMRFCIPVGDYQVSYEYDTDLNLQFVIRGVSTWRTMHFVGDNVPAVNTIKVGTEYNDDGYIKGGDVVMREMSELIEEMMENGQIPTKPKYGFFHLVILQAPDYHEGEYIPESDLDIYC